MDTRTQYNPNHEFNARLLAMGASKTVYALVTPETEATKAEILGDSGSLAREEYLDQFREAWTSKQDAYHRRFFDVWHAWSAPVIDLDREVFPFFYPCNGASETLRHLIYDFAAGRSAMSPPMIHIFEGEYEGYKAMAEAAGVQITEWAREDWRELVERLNQGRLGWQHLVFVSQPSAIDGMVWKDFNEFLGSIKMPNSVVVDLTYVGAVPQRAVKTKFNMNQPAVKAVVFSLSKPFGVYYDRIGGVFMREQDAGIYGNIWFKNLTSIRLGTRLMEKYDVFYMPTTYSSDQGSSVARVSRELGVHLLEPSDVFILAHGDTDFENPLADYLRRPEKHASGPKGKVRVCLTPLMAKKIAEYEAGLK